LKNLAYPINILSKGLSEIGSDPDNGSIVYRKISFPVQILFI
jgi:hypothetical protein